MNYATAVTENPSRDRLRGERNQPEPPLLDCDIQSVYVKQLEYFSKKGRSELTGPEYLWLVDLIQMLIHTESLTETVRRTKGHNSIMTPFIKQLASYLIEGKSLTLRPSTVYSLLATEEPHYTYDHELRVRERAVDHPAVNRFWAMDFNEMVGALHLLLKYAHIGE